MQLLLLGKNGQLGWELRRQLEQDFDVLALGREDVDFRNTKFFADMLRDAPKFDMIINAAAFTNVAKAPHRPLDTELINSTAVAILAEEAARRGVPMIHCSCVHVFSGQCRRRPYREIDAPNPLSFLGSTKLDGELRLRSILEQHLIFRLSGLYSAHHQNFFTEILTRNRKGILARVAADQIISPNWTPLVAEAIVSVIQRLFWGDDIPWGTYHLSGSGCTTPYGFAHKICEKINDVWGGDMPLPIPVRSRKTDCMAKRPKYSVLNSSKFNTTFRYTLPDWQEQFLRFFGGLDPRQVRQ